MKQSLFNKTKYVGFTLENCDEIYVNIKDIVSFNLDDITYDYRFYNDGWRNMFTKWPIVNSFSIELKASANKDRKPFNGACPETKTHTVFDRLIDHHDITSIKLIDKNWKDLATFYVPYEEPKGAEDSLGAPNILEKTELFEQTYWENKDLKTTKNLFISIKRK